MDLVPPPEPEFASPDDQAEDLAVSTPDEPETEAETEPHDPPLAEDAE
jgi:hypothetical protein